MNDPVNISDIQFPVNFSEIFIPSGIYNSGQGSSFFNNFNGRGIQIVTVVGAVPGVDTITISIMGQDPITGDPYPLASGPAIVATGTYILSMYPTITELANEKVSQILPETYTVVSSHSNPFVSNFTYGVSGYIAL